MSEILSLFERHCENIKGRGNQLIALCPFHDDTKHSFSINIDKGLYNCKSCGESGNAIKFAKEFGDDPKPFYSDDYKSPIKNRYKSVKPVKQVRNRNEEEYVPTLTTEELWEKIRYYQKEWHGLKWSNINCVGEHQGHLVFPYFDVDGKVPIGIKHHKPSFWEKGSDGRHKFYNEWLIPHMDKNEPLIIVEGEKDVITMMEEGYNAVSGSAGADAVPKIPQSFKQFTKIKILYDNDVYGNKGARKMAQAIYEQIGIIASIGVWDKSVPEKFDVTDDKESSNEAD
tara:strand:+ start:1023 stop:1874 length:852 start_codon:yes stop_codon:yes gene_type:complete